MRIMIQRVVTSSAVAAEAAAFVCVFTTFGMVHVGAYVTAAGYNPVYGVLVRLLAYFSCVALIAAQILVKRSEIAISLGSRPSTRIILGTGFALLSCGAGFLTIKRGNTSHLVDYATVAYVLVHVWRLWGTAHAETLPRTKKWLVAALVLGALILPTTTSKYINSESYPNLDEANRTASLFLPVLKGQSNKLVVPLDPDEAELVAANIDSVRLGRVKDIVGLYDYVPSAEGGSISVILDPQNISSLCLLGVYDGSHSWPDAEGCINAFLYPDSRSTDRLASTVGRIVFASNKTRRLVLEKLGSINLDNKSVVDLAQVTAHLRVMLARGAFFHHYNSIAHTINSARTIEDFFSNQYGFGPLAIAMLVTKLANVSVFDGIYVSVLVVNVLLAIGLAFFLRAAPALNRWVVWVGFAVSILVTYSISNMMAPFLFFIRMLPSVAVCLALLEAHLSQRPLKDDKWRLAAFSLGMLLVSVYNFEYAILTGGAVLIAGLLLRNKAYLVVGALCALVSILPKVVFRDPTRIGANYAAYLSGFGLGDSGVLLLMFIVSIAIVGGLLYRAACKAILTDEVVAISAIFLALCAKVAWMGSANHIGPLFLILSFVVFAIGAPRSGFVDSWDATMLRAYAFLNISIVAMASAGLLVFPFNKKLGTEKYVKTDISSIFSISEELVKKIDGFKQLYARGDWVLSPIDNVLSLSVKNEVTSPYPDVSTNINFPIDLKRVVDAYSAATDRRIIVDNYIANVDAWRSVYSAMAEVPYSIIYGLNPYDTELSDMRKVLLSIKASGFHECGQNRYFTVYCPPIGE